jgi:hypothetical protein
MDALDAGYTELRREIRFRSTWNCFLHRIDSRVWKP